MSYFRPPVERNLKKLRPGAQYRFNMLSPEAGTRGRKAETAGSQGGRLASLSSLTWPHPFPGPLLLELALVLKVLGPAPTCSPMHCLTVRHSLRIYLSSILPSGDVSLRTYCVHQALVTHAGRDLHKEPLVTLCVCLSHTLGIFEVPRYSGLK